jgi:hypothetical protein
MMFCAIHKTWHQRLHIVSDIFSRPIRLTDDTSCSVRRTVERRQICCKKTAQIRETSEETKFIIYTDALSAVYKLYNNQATTLKPLSVV